MMLPGHNFGVFSPMIMNLATGMKIDVFYAMVTKTFVALLLLRNDDVITCIFANV